MYMICRVDVCVMCMVCRADVEGEGVKAFGAWGTHQEGGGRHGRKVLLSH